MTLSKQRCSACAFLLSVLLEIGLFVLLFRVTNLIVGLVWLIVWPALLWVFLRFFPAIAHLVGYGLVEDVPLAAPRPTRAHVRLYTNLACPFCPLVKKRLSALQAHMDFELEMVDVSLRPDILVAKGILSVPVVEVGHRRLVGNVTSQQLAQLIEPDEGTRGSESPPLSCST
jgi:glutaredoxin